MARTLNKLDRMGLSESALGEETLEEVKDNVAEAMAALESFEEQREAASESFVRPRATTRSATGSPVTRRLTRQRAPSMR
jgi:hypothetical protein